MSAAAVLNGMTYRVGEHHAFESAGERFLYLVPSGAIFGLNGIAEKVIELLRTEEMDRSELAQRLLDLGYSRSDVVAAITELEEARAITRTDYVSPLPTVPAQEFPLQRIVLNVTNQCNLACGYCYEYSEDKISKPSGNPRYMDQSTAEKSVDLLFEQAVGHASVHVTFFGGETLLNVPLLRSTVTYAQARAAEFGKRVEFSLTTNATLLNEQVVDFLAEHRIGVTVSIDGDRELNDRMRVFHDGRGSYDVIVPKIRMLLERHKTNSIGARVTLTSGVTQVRRIYEHLTREVGFKAVGFSPATANPNRLYSIGHQKISAVLGGFEELALEYRDFALTGRQHGFTNANDTLKELHTGLSKAYPCGAGVGLLGVGTSGDLSLCHRFVDSDVGKMGNVRDGIDRDARRQFLETHHLGERIDCHNCWARPVCAGGCYHESYIHYGDTSAATLHYCDWIREWNDLCLRIYGEIAVRKPEFLARFDAS